MQTKIFTVKNGAGPKETIPEWRNRMKKEHSNFKEEGNSIYMSERGGRSTIRYTI